MRFRHFARAYVADRCRHQDALSAFQRAQHDLDRKRASILPPPGELNPRTDLLRQRLSRGSRTVRDQSFRETFRNDVLHLLPYEFIAAVSELFLCLNIQQDDLPARVHHHHRIRCCFQQPAIPALHLRQMSFRILTNANVADRCRHQDSLSAFQRTQHDLNRKRTSILPPPGELNPCTHLLRQHFSRGSRTVSDQSFRETFRNDVLHLLPYEFIAAVSELFLRLNIQQDDLPARVHHHHRIRCCFQQPAIPAFHLRQMLFGILAHADVADRCRHQDSLSAFQRAQHDLDRKRTSILPPPGELNPCTNLLRQRFSRGSRTASDQSFRETFRNDVLPLLPYEFIAAVSELFLRLNVQQDDLPARVHHHHRIRCCFQQSAIPAFHLRQMLFGILAHADVADRCRHQDSLSAFQRAQHDLDRKRTSILPPPGELNPCTNLLRQRFSRGSRTVSDQSFRETFRNDVLHLLPYEFIAAVSELFLRLNIQQDDLPARVHHHHRIRCCFQQPAIPAFHLRQMLFRILAHADVADRCRHQDSLSAFQRAQHDLNRKRTSILPPPGELNPCTDLLRQRLSRGSRTVSDQSFRETFRNDVLHLLPYEFIAAISELFLRLNVQQDDLPARVHHHHRIRCCFQQPAIPAFHLRQMLFRILAHADVADRCRHQDSLSAFQRAQHDLNRKRTSILPPPGELNPCTDLLRQRLSRGSRTASDQSFRETFRNDVLHLLPYEFIAAVSELFLRLNVQQDDLPARVHHHHRIRCCFQQSAIPAFHLRQMLFRILAHADVADRCRHQDSLSAFQRAQHDLNRKRTSILPPPGELNPCTDLLRQRLSRGSRTVSDQSFRETFRNDVLHLLPYEFIAAVSELFLRLNVQQDDLPARVHYHHRIRCCFQQSAILRSRLLA